mmetsp:Transcript_43587/g.100453  ORF Transcript_43587/g.100453 Transcript_43587/m.100453 type:complete len:217 (+) Transcript_43587:74-724(+)
MCSPFQLLATCSLLAVTTTGTLAVEQEASRAGYHYEEDLDIFSLSLLQKTIIVAPSAEGPLRTSKSENLKSAVSVGGIDALKPVMDAFVQVRESAKPGSPFRTTLASKFAKWTEDYNNYIRVAAFADFLEVMKTSFACVSVFAVLRALRRHEDKAAKVSAIIWAGEMQTLLCVSIVPPLWKAPAIALPLLTLGTILNGAHVLLSKDKMSLDRWPPR